MPHLNPKDRQELPVVWRYGVRDPRDFKANKEYRRHLAVISRRLWSMQEPIARGTPIILMTLLVNLCLNPLLQTNMVTGVKSDPEAGLKDYEKCKIQFTPGVRLGLSGLGKGHTRSLSLCQNWIAQISEMEAYPPTSSSLFSILIVSLNLC